ncbi:hypothetical protein SeMB42_g01591 [Synchytrium endobioticum]|uniref:Uncharacterized protein n=1 Tax=Synchytrium endobioticum TaxID=286115 RepID=A0A507D149_9FUNG|nr:hypothetical protein SeLEV6574_g04057 [Synchytrium endobioticum]TPX52183.1 hypothetical protein SeMB42_g01591 [Synchytrium endobioticum]
MTFISTIKRVSIRRTACFAIPLAIIMVVSFVVNSDVTRQSTETVPVTPNPSEDLFVISDRERYDIWSTVWHRLTFGQDKHNEYLHSDYKFNDDIQILEQIEHITDISLPKNSEETTKKSNQHIIGPDLLASLALLPLPIKPSPERCMNTFALPRQLDRYLPLVSCKPRIYVALDVKNISDRLSAVLGQLIRLSRLLTADGLLSEEIRSKTNSFVSPLNPSRVTECNATNPASTWLTRAFQKLFVPQLPLSIPPEPVFDNVFISLYESDSDDGTARLAQTWTTALSLLGIPHKIVTNGVKRNHVPHRIEFLAEVRNRVLDPLQELWATGERFDRVVFLNDVIFCAEDIVELVYQSMMQNASIACGLDYDIANKIGEPGFYDTWVARDINGLEFKKHPWDFFVPDMESAAKLATGLPFQVQCCYNGAAVYATEPLATQKAAFRRSKKGTECSASECSLMCNDLAALGYVRAMVVPRVRFAYDHLTYGAVWDRTVSRWNSDQQNASWSEFVDFESERIRKWRHGPKEVVCAGLERTSSNSPDQGKVLQPLAYPNVSVYDTQG